MDVSVTYDFQADPMTIQVMIFVPQEPATMVAPSFTIPLGTWLVQWNLVLGPNATGFFNGAPDKIELPLTSPPDGVTISDSHKVNDSTWQATIDNEVGEVEFFSYHVIINRGLLTTFKDPTVTVTPDPIDQPPSQ